MDGMITAYALNEPHHKTILTFKLQNGAQCSRETFGITSCSTSADHWCACNIKEPVDLEFDRSSGKSLKGFPRPKSVRPLSEGSASDISWLVQMSAVDRDQGKIKAFNDISTCVRAQINFGWQDAKSCSLDQVPDEGCGVSCKYKIFPNRFATNISGSEGHVQALAEHVMFETKFEDSPVHLVIKQRSGAGKINLDLGCSMGKCPDLLLVNDACGDMCATEDAFQDIGSHFGEYYKLAKPDPGERLVKHFPVRLQEDAVPLTTSHNGQLSTCKPDPFVERFEIALSRNEVHSKDEKIACPTDVFKILDAITLLSFQTRVICPMAVFEN